jgi:hypothetical protein
VGLTRAKRLQHVVGDETVKSFLSPAIPHPNV